MPSKRCNGSMVEDPTIRNSRSYCEGRTAAALGGGLGDNPHPSGAVDNVNWARGFSSWLDDPSKYPLGRDCCDRLPGGGFVGIEPNPLLDAIFIVNGGANLVLVFTEEVNQALDVGCEVQVDGGAWFGLNSFTVLPDAHNVQWAPAVFCDPTKVVLAHYTGGTDSIVKVSDGLDVGAFQMQAVE